MPWVDISEAAFTLGVSERTIRNWIKSGKLQARSVGGRREVEIPEPEHTGTAHAYTDDEAEGGQPLEVQKRLEVALIECGRVKGTLASQERMMESLSANIAELNAKLQKSERVIGRRTVWCVIIAFLGVGAWALTRSWYMQDELRLSNQQKDEIAKLKDKHGQELAAKEVQHAKAMGSQRLQLRSEKEKAVKELTDRLTQQHARAMGELKDEYGRRIKKLEEENLRLRGELDKEKEARLKSDADLKSLQKEIVTLEARREETSSLVKLQKARLEEVEKSRSELETELARWKKYYRRESVPSR